MSIRAADYVRDVAAREAKNPGARLVLLMLANRANASCGCTFSGEWLADACGMCDGSIRRHLDHLEDIGLISLRRRPGQAHVVRFPPGCFIHNPAHSCAGCKAWIRVEPRAELRGTPRSSARKPRAALRDVPNTNQEVTTGRTRAHGPLSREQRRVLISNGRKQAIGQVPA